ncbi:fusicoccadiene synthase [Lophiotrema nucula]|uniref:geranylgeranyl diphosphate synthase n=1 Tax=Lophiotrema nucula TaxID=690887 RepID=A0A6A5YG09_9PLEO|nr:fusicoccadiene synthase [Lophiotrema nucula]
MMYQFSTLVDEHKYDADGLCDGIPVRVHNKPEIEVAGTLDAQDDWEKLVFPLVDHHGGRGPRFGFMAVSMPECLPERFHIVSYANEFAFLYDDLIDMCSQEDVETENEYLSEGFHEGTRGTISGQGNGKRQIQAKILTKMMEIDRERAMVAMKAWAVFLETSSGREHHKKFNTLEEYLPYRCKDVGHMFWHALVTFGCALTVPEAELETCEQLVMPAVRAASLTNDLFSYDKERTAALAMGKGNVPNGIWILMREHSISLREAKTRCRKMIQAEVKKYVSTLEDVRLRSDLSEESKRYVELMQFSVSGNVVWSRECPRYHQAKVSDVLSGTQVDHLSNHSASEPLKRNRSDSSSQCSLPLTPDDSSAGIEALGTGLERKRQRLTPDCWGTAATIVPPETSLTANAHLDWLTIDPIGDAYLTKALPELGDNVIMGPFQYLQSFPSKGIRDKTIDAINHWLEVPLQAVSIVKSVVHLLHSSSLLLDDIQDGSQLRRGKPSAHVIFGTAQTINSATFLYNRALHMLELLDSPDVLVIFKKELERLFFGQSYDIHWSRELICPSTTEYLQMVDCKTGGLFRLLTQLLTTLSPHNTIANFDHLSLLFGRYFQIRDDYQNLTSTEYTAQKGFCEDLDEGKFSLPLLHALHITPHPAILRGLLQQRRYMGFLTREQKELVLEQMKQCGSLDYTYGILQTLYVAIEGEIARLEVLFGKDNFELRLLLNILKV